MEAYILDSLLRRDKVVDKFESFIWTERWNAYGEFEIKLASTPKNKSLFPIDSWMACNRSYRVMKIETVEDSANDDGEATLTIKGRSMEAILEDRSARNTIDNLTTTPSEFFYNTTPDNIAYLMIDRVLDPSGATEIHAGDKLSFYQPSGDIFPADTVPSAATLLKWEVKPKSLYAAVKELADIYDFGFRFLRNFDTSQIYVNTYTGSDRTTQQSTLPPVIFSQDLDNLKSTTELTTSAALKNVAYVWSPVGFEIVYADSVDPDATNFERRILTVLADDITTTDPTEATNLMIEKGKAELAQHRSFYGFDGQLSRDSQYVYDVDYYLGDLVEMRKADGATNTMRVTEQIFASDGEGERAYPTLTVNSLITPGSWLAWEYQREWADFGLTEYWADQP